MKGTSRQLIVGQLVGQMAALVAIPVLTRLVSAEEMGVYQTGLSVALILQPLASLRRELLIPFAEVQEAERNRRTALGFGAGCSGVLALVALVMWTAGAGHVGAILLSTAFILLSLVLIYIENAYLILRGEHGRLASRNLIGGGLSACLQILTGLVAPNAIAIALALLVGRAIATAVTSARLSPVESTPRRAERKSQRPISAVLSPMLATASTQAVIIGSFVTLGATAAAQVGLAQRVAAIPTSLIGQALTQIALSHAAPLIREQRPGLTSRLRMQTVKATVATVPVTIALMVGGPLLAGTLLGDDWEPAGDLTAIFAVPLALSFVALPATTLLIPLGRERLLAFLQFLRLLVILLSLAIGSRLADDVLVTSAIAAVTWSMTYVPLLTAAFAGTARHDRECGAEVLVA